MADSAHNMILLKPSSEEKFNKIYAQFAKTQPNAMRFTQFMQFLLDRSLITNKTTLNHFYNLFVQATVKRITKEPPPPPNTNAQKIIKKEELIFLLNQLGKYLYHNCKGYQDKIYNDLLGQKIVADKDSIQFTRVLTMDEPNRKLFMQNSIKTITSFEQQLKNIFLLYVDENYWTMKHQKRILLGYREIQLQNKRMTALSFVRLLKEAEILPHIINIEYVEEILGKIVPHTSPKQNQFYYKHFLVDAYSKDLDDQSLKHDGDPGLSLFQMILTLSRIAVETSKQVENTKKVYDYIINKFFKGYLNLRTNQELEQSVELKVGNRPLLIKLLQFYRMTSDEYDENDQDSQQEYEETALQIMKQKQRNMDKDAPLQLNTAYMLSVLEGQVPALPEQIQIKQEQPPPYPKKFKDIQKVIIGQQPPPQKVDKNKANKPPAKKKANLKKGEKPPRVFQYKNEAQQTKKVNSSEDYFQKLATQLDYSLKPLSSLDRGNIPLDPFPSIIAEILYPTEIPESVLPYIQAGLNAHNESRYALSIQNYRKGHQVWKQEAGVSDLKPHIELFFEFTQAGVFLSAGKDDYALQGFFNCRLIAEKMNYLNPDRALPYCGIGEVLYNAEQYEMATRCYLKARQIREKLLGVECVDTATVFNNLGCCFFMIERNKEALSYFKIGQTVLVSQLGQFHERSQTAKQNVQLCNKSFYANKAEFRKLWEVYEKNPFGKKKKKKKKKK